MTIRSLCKDEYQKIIEEAYEGFRKFREEKDA